MTEKPEWVSCKEYRGTIMMGRSETESGSPVGQTMHYGKYGALLRLESEKTQYRQEKLSRLREKYTDLPAVP